jgi:nucleoside-diphosphate-sugar epimerase
MNYLITGATGFLGQALCKAIAPFEHVFAVARKAPHGKGRYANVDWIEADLSAPLDPSILPSSIDAVVHLAQSPYYRDFPKKADHVFAVNVAATQTLLDYAVNAGAKRFIFASSGSVYEPYNGPMTEDAALAPTSFYSASKLAGEALVRAYAAQFSACMLRIFFLYGPNQVNKLIPDLINKVKSQTPITLFGPGKGMVITPTFIDDAVKACVTAVEQGWSGPINLAPNAPVSLYELASEIGQAVGQSPVFEHKKGEAPTVIPDTSLLNTLFPTSNFTSLVEGLRKTISTSETVA